MKTAVPEQFEEEYWSNSYERRMNLPRIASSMASMRTSIEEQVAFLVNEGWTEAFSQWVTQRAKIAGIDFELVSPAGSSYDEQMRDYDRWKTLKARNEKLSVLWGATSLIITLSMIGIVWLFPKENMVISISSIILLFSVYVGPLIAAFYLCRAKGLSIVYVLFSGCIGYLWLIFMKDQNKLSIPTKPKNYDLLMARQEQLLKEREFLKKAEQSTNNPLLDPKVEDLIQVAIDEKQVIVKPENVKSLNKLYKLYESGAITEEEFKELR
jgi:hypothetical protein